MKCIKKSIISLMVCLCMMVTISMPISAADIGECYDGSYLINDDFSEGISDALTRGVYYKSGSSSLSKAGTGRIAAGGTTVAQQVVSTVSVTVRVERLVNGRWQVYTSWSATEYNSALVHSSKTLSVPTGYYYRTHCFHSANSDSSTSLTDGLWI